MICLRKIHFLANCKLKMCKDSLIPATEVFLNLQTFFFSYFTVDLLLGFSKYLFFIHCQSPLLLTPSYLLTPAHHVRGSTVDKMGQQLSVQIPLSECLCWNPGSKYLCTVQQLNCFWIQFSHLKNGYLFLMIIIGIKHVVYKSPNTWNTEFIYCFIPFFF